MDEMQQITLDQWMYWKEDIREKLRETAGNFVYIGFRLKQIRDSGMFDGAADIFKFALNEYGLSKSTTSRFIAINEKFSEGGNSIELREEYKALGSSKLAEMLTLPDAECQMITERTTVSEIRALKNFSRQQASEAGEDEVDEEEKILTPLQKCLVDYFKDKKEMLNAVVTAIYDDNFRAAAELMNPSGYGTHKKGICFMFMYDFNAGVKTKLLTEPEPQTLTWPDVLMDVYSIFANIYESGEDDVYKAYYGEPEKEDSVATSQQSEEEAESESKIGVKKVPETRKNQNAKASVATSQQKGRSGENKATVSGNQGERSEADGDTGNEEPHREPATDTNGETGEQTSGRPAHDADGDMEWIEHDFEENEAQSGLSETDLEKIWKQIKDEEIHLNVFFMCYDSENAKNRKIPLENLKRAYESAVNMAAGIERLRIDAEERSNENE